MGFSLILRAFFSFPNERQFIECQFFWEFRKKWGKLVTLASLPHLGAQDGKMAVPK